MRGKLSGEEIRLCADCWFQCAVVKPVSGVMLSVLFSHSILDFSHPTSEAPGVLGLLPPAP